MPFIAAARQRAAEQIEHRGDGPVLFEQQPDSTAILLYSGRDQLILTPSREPDGGYQLDLLPGGTRSSAEQLELWLCGPPGPGCGTQPSSRALRLAVQGANALIG